jgi:hypothetical protein
MPLGDDTIQESRIAQLAHELKKLRRREARYHNRRRDDVRRWCARRDGSSGAAGPCKRIDPVTGELIGIIPSTDA